MSAPTRFCLMSLGVLTLALAGGWSPQAQAAEVYKSYDENGNPVYTDRPPEPGAEPISLRELSVVETPEYPSRNKTLEEEGGQPNLNDMRRRYQDFQLVSPDEGENIWGTGNVATIAWQAGAPLAEGLSVVFYVDGEPATQKTRATNFNTGRLDRGEHQARVELLDEQDRVVATAGPVTFYIMQQSRINRPRAGGG